MFEETTVVAVEGATITVNINTNIVEAAIFLNAVDETAVLGGKFTL